MQKGNNPAAGLQPSSRTKSAPFLWVGTGGPLSEPYIMTSTWTCVFTLVAKLSDTAEGGTRAQHPPVGSVLTAHHHATWLVFAREHAVSAVFFLPDKHMWQMWESLEILSKMFNIWTFGNDLGGMHRPPAYFLKYQDEIFLPLWDKMPVPLTPTMQKKLSDALVQIWDEKDQGTIWSVWYQNHTQMFSGVHTATFPNGGSVLPLFESSNSDFFFNV